MHINVLYGLALLAATAHTLPTKIMQREQGDPMTEIAGGFVRALVPPTSFHYKREEDKPTGNIFDAMLAKSTLWNPPEDPSPLYDEDELSAMGLSDNDNKNDDDDADDNGHHGPKSNQGDDPDKDGIWSDDILEPDDVDQDTSNDDGGRYYGDGGDLEDDDDAKASPAENYLEYKYEQTHQGAHQPKYEGYDDDDDE